MMVKRTIDLLDEPPPKRQSTLSFGAFTRSPTVKEASATGQTCRLLNDGYIDALVRKHGADNRYDKYLRTHTVDDISKTLRERFTPALLEVIDGRKETDLAAIRAIGGDTHFSKVGWYLNILTDENDPEWFALYPGQSIEVDKRIRYHRTHYHTHNSLHYFAWRQPGKKSVFVLLGRVPDGLKDTEILLNIGEQLLGVVFQALPEKMLPEYLPVGVKVRLPHRGLMVARPMNQSHSNATSDSWMIWRSSDSIARKYAEIYYKESLDRGRKTQVKQQQAGQISTKRCKSKKAHLFRDPDPSQGDLICVMRWCRVCKAEQSQSLDPAPIYEISTGRYIARKGPCNNCQETAPARIARSKNGRKTTYHIPVNTDIPYIRQEAIR